MYESILNLDKKPYPAYKSLKRTFHLEKFQLTIDYVQGDPFAAPSKIVLKIPQDQFTQSVREHWIPSKKIPLCDFFGRRMARLIKAIKKSDMGSGKSGLIRIDHGGQYILDRASCQINEKFMLFHMEVGLPAYGRRIAAHHCVTLLCDQLPELITNTINTNNPSETQLTQHIHCYLNDLAIRAELRSLNAIAFIADGSILPRQSGDSQRPLTHDPVPFRTPPELSHRFLLPYEYAGRTEISGMLLPRGIHLITGGGYHGKSTLLQSLSQGVYCNIPGDGRELVICDENSVHIKAEEGRSVCGVDIRALIDNLPGKHRSDFFYSQDASGSTSQAASIIEAMEAGSRVLLMDEDTSATNLLIRDARMQALVEKSWEPITALIDRIRDFYDLFGVSTILVIGGCGDYLEIADLVLKMEQYTICNVTDKARQIVAQFQSRRTSENIATLQPANQRRILAQSIDPSRGKYEIKLDFTGTKILQFGNFEIDLRGLEQITDPSQLRAAALALVWIKQRAQQTNLTLQELLLEFNDQLNTEGLQTLWGNGHHPGDLARPRIMEVAAILNRLRPLQLIQ